MSGDRANDEGLAAAITGAEVRRQALFARRIQDRPALPLRWWRQEAHLSVPGSNAQMVRKALERGTAPTARLMAGVSVGPADVADRLQVDVAAVERLLERPRSAPVVLVDLEDGQSDRPDVRALGVSNAAEAFSTNVAPAGAGRPLRFLRPPGLDSASGVDELLRVLWGAQRPPDAVLLPKVAEPDEVSLLLDLLSDAEAAHGHAPGTIRVGLLIESGAAVLRLPEIAERAGPRLCALMFGLADLAADMGLPQVDAAHPAAVWARTQIVAVAGSLDVPAIDGMTFAYPVSNPDATAAANREAFLGNLATAYADTRTAQALGMSGKLVGHPAQLFATLLAYETAVPRKALEAAASSVERYAAAREHGEGATMIDGQMADVATDRHARRLLRVATANSRFDPNRALSLGVIDAAERDEIRAETGADGRVEAGAETRGAP